MQHLYYVDKCAHDGWHLVHTGQCEHLSTESRRHFLGVFIRCTDAVKEARRVYDRAKGCLYCCRIDSD